MKEMKNPINQRIAKYRNLAGYTQETAAQALGLKKNTYARMERMGNPRPDQLKEIANLYGVSTAKILFGETGVDGPEPEGPLLPEQIKEFTVNEKNIIKLLRTMPREKRLEILEIINEYYKKYGNK